MKVNVKVLSSSICSKKMMQNIDNILYLRYRLKNVINLTSRYSYVLFLYLLDNRFRKSWCIDLADLKALLTCNADRYKQFKFFNAEILKKCHRELCEKTDINFDYKPIKRGRSVSAVEFTVNTINDGLEEQLHSEHLNLDDTSQNNEFIEQNIDSSEPIEIDYGSELSNLLGNAACDNEFSIEQVRPSFELKKIILRWFPITLGINGLSSRGQLIQINP